MLYLHTMQVNFLRCSNVRGEFEYSTANNNCWMAIPSMGITYFVIYVVWWHLESVHYAVILLEIISFIFIWLTHIETSGSIQISSHLKESLLAYLIPSLLSLACALIGLFFSGLLWNSEILSTSCNELSYLWNFMYITFITASLVIKMGLFPFFVYTLNVNQGISWNAIFFIGVTSKLPVLIVMIHYGKIVNPWIMIVVGIFSMLMSSFIIFSSVYVKRYMAASSLGVMGWLSTMVGVYHLTDDSWFGGGCVSFFLWFFFIVYGCNTLGIIIMLEHCYPLFLSSYRGELEIKGYVLGSWYYVDLRFFGVLYLIS